MQLSLFLEVRKLLKLQGVAYLEGRLKSRSYCNYASVRMPSEVYGSVCVCVCVCACACACVCVCLCRLLQLLKDESSTSKSFYRLLVMFT